MPVSYSFKACLFDLDGTLVNSTAAIDRAWSTLARRHGMDPETVIRSIHGRPAEESLAELLSHLPRDQVEAEIAWLQERESTDVQGVVPIDGALDFIARLEEHAIPWAIVTSGTHPVATARMKAAGIPAPEIFVTSDLITRGKPDPEPYLLGAEKARIDPASCIVFEDAPAGITSGLAANCSVVGVTAIGVFDNLGPVPTIQSYRSLGIRSVEGNYELVVNG